MIKSVIMNSDGSLEEKEFEKPILETGSVLIKMKYSEVCGTDVHLANGQLAGVPYPIIPGHVSTGEISEVAGEVFDIEGSKLEVGDMVTFLDVHETCNSCWYCLVAKETTRCPKRKVYGITYSSNDGLLGGWSQFIYLKPGVKIIKLPTGLDPKTFMAGGCGLPTAFHAIQRSNIKLGDTVLVQGSGPVGLICAVLAKLSGAFKVIMTGAPKLRLEIASKFEVDELINIDEVELNDRIASVKSFTNGRGADVVIEATGVPAAINEGLKMIRDGGSYIVAGQYTEAGNIEINPHEDINKKHITIKGSWGSDFSHFYLAVNFMNRYKDRFPWQKMITNEFTLSRADDALQSIQNLTSLKTLIYSEQ